MLADRIRAAISVLGSDGQAGGSLREQAASMFGCEVDDKCLRYMQQTSWIVYNETKDKARAGGFKPEESHRLALVNVLISGMAIGKRLGIEDGECFAREIGEP